MNRQQAFETLEAIAATQGISIENRIRPNGDWMVTSLSCFRAVHSSDAGETLIFLSPHRVAAVVSQSSDHVKLAEAIVAKANHGKLSERAACQMV
jgi:hypothetical protein